MNDSISRQEAIDAVDSETVSTNPEHFKSSEKFIKFMDDADIASFGKWQWANGFNTALVATKIQLKKLPSAQPERKKGEWIPHKSIFGGLGERVYTCDQCSYNIGFHTENFCPNCGADMREEGEQE